jgi:hypothetical protein
MVIRRTQVEDLQRADKDGRLPVHRNVKNNVSMAATKLLAEHCPDALFHDDNRGRLPLFYAIVGLP